MEPDPSEYFDERRLRNLENLKESSHEAYPHTFSPDASIEKVITGEYTGEAIRIAGVVVRKDINIGVITIGESYDGPLIDIKLPEDEGTIPLEYVDNGDLIGITGQVVTSSSDREIVAEELEMIAKSLLPPTTNQEKARYPETLRYQDVAERVELRSDMLREIRKFLWDRGLREVDTPILKRVYGGSEAEPFRTEMNGERRFMRVALELHLKRHVVGGFNDIFEIGKAFRKDDLMDNTHIPEFTVLEVIETWKNYEDMMELMESLVNHIVTQTDVEPICNGQPIDFSPGWQRLTVEEAVSKYSEFDIISQSKEEVREILISRGVVEDQTTAYGLGILKMFEEEVEHQIFQPTFIIDHPKETTPLCKEHRNKANSVERFEVICAGMEIANAYTELNNPITQLENFATEYTQGYTNEINTDFVKALSRGMPPAGGLGIGIDRLLMLLTDSDSIREVIPYAEEYET